MAQDGTGKVEFTATRVTVAGTATNSLFRTDGTSIVIHANPDDETTDPSGNSGARVACGVIARR